MINKEIVSIVNNVKIIFTDNRIFFSISRK